jgi:hypothetical protein
VVVSEMCAYINAFVIRNKHRISGCFVALKNRTTTWRESHKTSAILLFICLLFPATSMATEVIMIISRNLVVLAADSLQVRRGGKVETVCKIHQTGHFWWVAGGIASDEDTGFDVTEFFTAVAKEGLDTSHTLDAIGCRIKGSLQKELPVLKQQQPDFYKKVIDTGEGPVVIFAARIAGNQFEAFMKGFKLINGKIVPQPSSTCPPNEPQCVLGAKIPEVDRYIASHPDIWTTDTIENVIDHLMNIAMAAEPKEVGPPVSILFILKNGPKWIRQNNCEAIKP